MRDALVVGGKEIAPGERATVHIPVSRRSSLHEVWLPCTVVRGRRDGPRLFVCAAIHGDEIGGVEIVRRLLSLRPLARLRGALIVVPIVKVYGFWARQRTLPDRRDLNRCFPGSPSGSLASRLAHVVMDEIVSNATHGIDLHTGSGHRTNLPQVRAFLDDETNPRRFAPCALHLARCASRVAPRVHEAPPLDDDAPNG